MSYQLKFAAHTLELETMLTLRRPARSKTEKRLIKNFIDVLPNVKSDRYGNRYVKIGAPNILWSCHTDTVHRQAGNQSIVKIDDFIALAPHEINSSCLGGDCSTGVWLMAEMIRRKIPGLYIFHRDEEIGGHGSSHIARDFPQLLTGINAAIAFDRKGYDSIITFQGSGRCASNAFADSLALQLPGAYRPDDSGIFTDTANYTDIIGECSNISVGYENAHSPKETQNIKFAAILLEALCDMDQNTLTFERKPGETDYLYSRYYSNYGASGFFDDWQGATSLEPRRAIRDNQTELLALCKNYPEYVAAFLDDQLGLDAREIDDYMLNARF